MEVGSLIQNSTKSQHVLCSTDDNFAQHCGVMMCSLFSVGVNTHYIVHILEAGLSEENKQKLTSIGDMFQQDVIFHYVDKRYSEELKVHQDCNVSNAAYYRLYVSSIITDTSIDKILYLDCDVVINRDILDIFELDMTDYYVAAVRDVKNPIRENHQLSIGFSYQDRYFNSGILLLNLKKWRSDRIQETLVLKAKQLNSKTYPDQDPLNAVFRNKWLELPPSWNRFNVVKYEDVYFKNKADELEYIYNPRIIHFASPAARPWMDMKFVPFGKKYEVILAKTPWKGAKKLKVKTSLRYKHLLEVKYTNLLYRSPQIIKLFVTSLTDILLVAYHLLKHRSLKYYSPYRK